MDIGVIATSGKPGERRLPLHPGHVERLSADVRGCLYLETGYGEPFGFSESSPVRERPPSQYIATQPPSARIFSAVMNASSSRWPRRTGNTPPGE